MNPTTRHDASLQAQIEKKLQEKHRNIRVNYVTAAGKVKTLTRELIKDFQATIYQHYNENGRDLTWRTTNDPYEILVSEIMLQQTQVQRVTQKYDPFLGAFPDFQSLAQAHLRDVLALWKGLGYNRRAMWLQRIAMRVVGEFQGRLPESGETLRTFPGIGNATAGALMAFAFQWPAVFIETNIRRVFLHFFFLHKNNVRDKEILPLIEKTLVLYFTLVNFMRFMLLFGKGTNSAPNLRSNEICCNP